MRLARSNAYTGLSRFTGRSVDRLFLTAMRRPHRYPGPGDLIRVGEEIAGAHALYEAVLAACECTLPANHPDLLRARGNLANTMTQLGDLAGARALD